MQAWRPTTSKDFNADTFCEYHEIFKTSFLKIICERLLLKVKLNLPKVCKLSRVSESATFSNTTQTRLLLPCKFPEELHFWAITFEINCIIFFLFFYDDELFMSYVLIVILFVKQDILIVWNELPERQKQAVCESSIWFFSLVSK